MFGLNYNVKHNTKFAKMISQLFKYKAIVKMFYLLPTKCYTNVTQFTQY